MTKLAADHVVLNHKISFKTAIMINNATETLESFGYHLLKEHQILSRSSYNMDGESYESYAIYDKYNRKLDETPPQSPQLLAYMKERVYNAYIGKWLKIYAK